MDHQWHLTELEIGFFRFVHRRLDSASKRTTSETSCGRGSFDDRVLSRKAFSNAREIVL